MRCSPFAALLVAAAPLQSGDGWGNAEPADAGLDRGALEALALEIRAGEFENVHAVVVAHEGRIVFERYYEGPDSHRGRPLPHVVFEKGTLHDLRSVTKSVTAVLLGISLGDEADAALATPVAELFPGVDPDALAPELERVTLWHALTMTAGLEWNEMERGYDGQNDAVRLYRVEDPVAMVLARAVRTEPGAEWYYNGGLTQLLGHLVQVREGKSLSAYADEVLFGPLGITDYDWPAISSWSPEGSPSAKAGLRLSARDLAKIGAVYADGGKWNGAQVVPAEWVAKSSTRHVDDVGLWSRGGTYGYGFQWWHGRHEVDGETFVTVSGNGRGDQRVFVVQGTGLVVTVLAGNYDTHVHRSGERILRRVLAARAGD